MTRFNRLLITGAAGNLGRELRRGLVPLAQTLRLSDRADMESAGRTKKSCVVSWGILTRS